MKIHDENKILMAEDVSCISRLVQLLDDMTTGKNLEAKHPQWKTSVADHLKDVLAMSECIRCGELCNQFWCYLRPLEMPVVLKCQYHDGISFLMFLITRHAKLSLHRMENAEFNDDELRRIMRSINMLQNVKFTIYNCNGLDVNLRLQDSKGYVLVTL